MNTVASRRSVHRLRRLSRLQELTTVAAEDACRTAQQACVDVERRIDASELRLRHAQDATRAGARVAVGTWRLMSEACDAQLACLAELAGEKREAELRAEQAREALAQERRRRDVLDESIERRAAMLEQHAAVQLEHGISDLWLAARSKA